MAIPKTLKSIDKQKAEKIISKHLKEGTGEYEDKGAGDFIYKTPSGRYYLIRNTFGIYETGRVSL